MTSRLPGPTNGELEILRVLWRRGPSTVHEVHQQLRARTGYTTTLKLLQNMHAKRLVRRDESRRQHVYDARLTETAALGALVADLAMRAFDGSRAALAMRALGAGRIDTNELEELKTLLEQLERDGANPP